MSIDPDYKEMTWQEIMDSLRDVKYVIDALISEADRKIKQKDNS